MVQNQCAENPHGASGATRAAGCEWCPGDTDGMPIVVVTAERLPDEATEISAASSLASAIAESRGLPHHEVYETLTGANVAVVGQEPVRPWPVVVIYGRESGDRKAAVAAVKAVSSTWWNIGPEKVWVQWVEPDPPR